VKSGTPANVFDYLHKKHTRNIRRQFIALLLVPNTGNKSVKSQDECE